MIQLPNGSLLIEVPENTIDFGFIRGDLFCSISGAYMYNWHTDVNEYIEINCKGKELYMLGLASSLTEDQASEIVERWASGKYNDYMRHLARVDTALASLSSLLQLHNLQLDRTVVLKMI